MISAKPVIEVFAVIALLLFQPLCLGVSKTEQIVDKTFLEPLIAKGDIEFLKFTKKIETDKDNKVLYSSFSKKSQLNHKRETFLLPVSSCDKFVEWANDLFPVFEHKNSEYKIKVGFNYISYQGIKSILVLNYICNESTASDTTCPYYTKNEISVNSFVGPFLTISTYREDESACGYPSGSNQLRTYDLRNVSKSGQWINYTTTVLANSFVSESLLPAIKSDSFIVKSTSGNSEWAKNYRTKLNQAQNFNELSSVMTEFGQGIIAFSFYDFSKSTGLAALRLNIQSQDGPPGSTTTLGLWVQPKKWLVPHLEAALSENGHFFKKGKINIFKYKN